MKSYYLVIVTQLLLSCELLAQGSRSITGYTVTDIDPRGSGYENFLEHHQSLSEKFLIGARADNQHRFELTDEAFNFMGTYREPNFYTFVLGAGTARTGELLPKTNIFAEFSRENKEWSLSISYNYRHYSDVRAQILAVGPDIVLDDSSLLILRAYAGHTYFDQTERASGALAVMIKYVRNFHQHHSWNLFFGRGNEGILRSSPPQNELVEVRSLGGAARFKLNERFFLVPETSLTQYPDLNLEIRRYGLALEVQW